MENYATIDVYRTGQNIKMLMQRNGLAVRDIQKHLGLATPQSIYHWFKGRSMPTVDNLYALSDLLHVPVDAMLCGNRKENYYFYRHTSRNHLYAYYARFLQLQARQRFAEKDFIVLLQ